MLDERVLQAVRAGQFHVYAVRHVDEALSLLVGEDAGTPNAEGQFPAGSVNARVVERLREIAEIGMTEDDKEVKADEPVALPKEKKPRAKKPVPEGL
jgi:predicted ATP-dependent protease